MEAHKKLQKEEARREAENTGGSELKQLAAEMADVKAGFSSDKRAYIHPLTWMSCAQVYALACSITAAGPVTAEIITNHITTISRVNARTNNFPTAMRYDVLARSKWESQTGLDLGDFNLAAYVKTIDEELLTTVCLCFYSCMFIVCVLALGERNQ
jgi:hypothetical protein